MLKLTFESSRFSFTLADYIKPDVPVSLVTYLFTRYDSHSPVFIYPVLTEDIDVFISHREFVKALVHGFDSNYVSLPNSDFDFWSRLSFSVDICPDDSLFTINVYTRNSFDYEVIYTFCIPFSSYDEFLRYPVILGDFVRHCEDQCEGCD